MINGRLKHAGELYQKAKEIESQPRKKHSFEISSDLLCVTADNILFEESKRLGIPFSKLKEAIVPLTLLDIVEDLQYGQR